MQKDNKGENYINSFPYLRKWVNECLCCHRKGYKPELPESISTTEGAQDVYYLKKYFRPLYVDENGLCEICAKLLQK